MPPNRILLVEDERVLRELVGQFLRMEGYDVVDAADGLQGLERFVDLGPFDVALVDLNLPGLSGVDLCSRIKQVRPSQPVLICSAAILDDHLVALRALDVDQYLTKPYHPRDLLGRIEALIDSRPKRERTTIHPGEPRATSRHPAPHRRPASPHALFNQPAID